MTVIIAFILVSSIPVLIIYAILKSRLFFEAKNLLPAGQEQMELNKKVKSFINTASLTTALWFLPGIFVSEIIPYQLLKKLISESQNAETLYLLIDLSPLYLGTLTVVVAWWLKKRNISVELATLMKSKIKS